MKASLLMVTLIGLLAASTAWAGFFGPSEGEIRLTLQAYFDKVELTVDDYFTLDLASIQSDRHAKILVKVLDDLLDSKQAGLDAKLVALEAKGRDVERYFEILYSKEIRDALWLQTRPAKENAYRKAYTEHRAILDSIRVHTTTVRKGEDVYTVLKKISKRFKAIEP